MKDKKTKRYAEGEKIIRAPKKKYDLHHSKQNTTSKAFC